MYVYVYSHSSRQIFIVNIKQEKMENAIKRMEPPPLVLGLMIEQKLHWRFSVKAKVGQESVVGQQPIG